MSFGMVDPAVIRDVTLPPMVKLVYTHLATYCSDQRSAFPSRATIAKQIGVSVRTVDSALKTAEKVHLITVQRRRVEKRHRTSVYVLHDFDGGYISGAGPVGGSASPAPPDAGDARGGAGAAPELDHGSTPRVQTITTSSDAACAPRAAARGQQSASQTPKLHLRRDFANLTDKGARRHLVAAAIKAMRHVGLTPTPNAAHRIGRALKEQHEAGTVRVRLAEMLSNTIADPVTNELVAAAIVPGQRSTSDPNPAADLDVDDMEFCEQIEELVDGDGVRVDTTAMIYGMASAGAHPNAIYNAARKNERSDPWTS